MQSRPTFIVLFGIYFVLSGLVLCAHIFYPGMDRHFKKRVHSKAKGKMQKYGITDTYHYIIDKEDRADFYRGREELNKSLEQFKQDNIERTTRLSVLITAAGFLVGALYLVAGFGLLELLPWAKTVLTLGAFFSVVYAGLFALNAYSEIYYLDQVFVKIWQLAEILGAKAGKEAYFSLGKALSSFGVMRAAPFLAFWILAYILPAVYFLTHPKARMYL